MRTLLGLIDSMSEWVGRVACWLCVALIGVMTYEVIMRYAFDSPRGWTAETSMMLGATIASLGLAYTHRFRGHVRVDVIYRLLPPRGRTIIDVIVGLLFLFPLFIALAYFAAGRMWWSWSASERLISTSWYPPAGPIRTIMFLGLSLFVLQSAAHFIRDIYFLVRNKSLD